MFASADINKVEEILGCNLTSDVVKEALNPNSVLWGEIDGERFVFLTIEEHRNLKRFREDPSKSPLPLLPELRILWTDHESNFMGVFVSGPILGRLAFMGHDTNIDCAPLYRNVTELKQTLDQQLIPYFQEFLQLKCTRQP